MKARLFAAVAVLVVIAGCGLGGKDEDKAAGSAPAPVAATPDDVPTSSELLEEEPAEEPTDEPSPTPSKKKSKKPKPAKATPTEDPFNYQLPDCYDFIGKKVSKAKAKAALNAAAAKTYWPTSAPNLKVPADLVRAVAWHESGWTSNIKNCDGGFGLMQVMPDTVTFINGRFEQSYDVRDYRENAILGANQLAWLTKYFGEKYFGEKYNLSTSKCSSDASPCLLNLVIDGYNMGFGDTERAFLDDKKLSNPEYVHLIRANMRECDCDRF